MISSNPDPTISVIIPAFGRPARLRALLDGLMQQDFPHAECEIIVVDDGSPEPIEPSITDLVSLAPIAVRVLRQANGGPSAARNHGAAAARGEFLLFIDDDLSVPRDLLRCHLKVQRECGPALLNCALEWRIEAEPEPFAVWYRQRTADWGQARKASGRVVVPDVMEIAAPLASTANLSIARADFQRLRGFDAEYPYGCEDQDFAARADRAGVRILFTTRTVALHVETHNTLRKLCQRQRMGARDTVRFLKRFAVEHHVGLPDIARYNNPVAWRSDGSVMASKKTIRRILTLPGVGPTAFGMIRIAETMVPRSAWLGRAYDLMVGAFAQKGWREGLYRHRGVEPLEDWKPAATDKTIASTK